eukprot:TRINITY_DN3088_c0_g1_i3.p1 TRINITY_DN3088_c0_g1~~TRINITY_DN3088_c0_g1_i3.p1  ORF type:complete len:603 (-),score=61.55 TRINITY_DN3088_c0_g1_i3:625-2433(-)
MDLGNNFSALCDPNEGNVADLLNSNGNENGSHSGAANGGLLKAVGRSVIPDFSAKSTELFKDVFAQDASLKGSFELKDQQNLSGGGRSEFWSPWAVHALLQQQTYSPFRATAGLMGNTRHSYGFTALQWQELEHQALIFKYILAQEPVPPELLIPIKRSLSSTDFARHQSALLGWTSCQMRFATAKTDSEPGRCRRTDGKKWRCSRDAAPDQKYCERHMHRGRPRSRKPVEGGQTVSSNAGSGVTSSVVGVDASSKPVDSGGGSGPTNGPTASSLSSLAKSSSVGTFLRPTAAAASNPDQFLNLKSVYGGAASASSATTSTTTSVTINGSSEFKTPSLVPKDCRYMNWMKEASDHHHQQQSNMEASAITTPLRHPSSTKSAATSNWLLQYPHLRVPQLGTQEMTLLQGSEQPQINSSQNSALFAETQQPLRHFIDDWSTSEEQQRSPLTTQLSMSLPMTTKTASTDLGLGLMMDNDHNRQRHQQSATSYIPVALGGPLAEALQHSATATTAAITRNPNPNPRVSISSAALNLLSSSNDGSSSWDFSGAPSPQQSPRMASCSSPSGVIQRTLASLSDSSSGSSIANKHNNDATLHHHPNLGPV